MTEVSLHFYDAARPDDDENVFPVYVYTDVIPRVGDSINYHIDYYGHEYSDGEPGSITGKVEKVEIEYRRFKTATVPMVLVWLSDYMAGDPVKQ